VGEKSKRVTNFVANAVLVLVGKVLIRGKSPNVLKKSREIVVGVEQLARSGCSSKRLALYAMVMDTI
jgi:hypothetical protein